MRVVANTPGAMPRSHPPQKEPSMKAMAVLAMLVAISSCSGGGGAPTATTRVEPPPAEPPIPPPPPPVALANCEPGAPVWMEIPVCAEGSRNGYDGDDFGSGYSSLEAQIIDSLPRLGAQVYTP